MNNFFKKSFFNKSISKLKQKNNNTVGITKSPDINKAEDYDVFNNMFDKKKSNEINELQNINELEDTTISDIFKEESDKNESYEINKIPINNELDDTIISETFNEESNNHKLHEIKETDNTNELDKTINSELLNEEFDNKEPYEINEGKNTNELDATIISDSFNDVFDSQEHYEINEEENTDKSEGSIVSDAFNEVSDENKPYELSVLKNTYDVEDSIISDVFNKAFDENKSYEINKKKNVNDLKDSNITDHFNEVFDLNTYNYDENENEVKENLNQHKNQDSNLFLKALNYLNPSSLFLTLIIFVFVGSGFWATFTELDEVIRCSGQVVPASNAKVIQSEFQGKVSSINYKVGDNVKLGDILLTLKDSDFVTEININKEDYFSSLALIDRLEGESNFKKPVFSSELRIKRPDLMNAQLQVYKARVNKLKDNEKLLKNELERLIYNIEEVKADIQSFTTERKFLDEELKILSPLVKRGFEPRLKLVQTSQRLTSLDSKILKSRVAIPGIQIDVRKITQKLKNLRNDFISKAKEEIIAAKDRFNKSVLKSNQLNQRLMGTEIIAPVNGLISKVEISTIGAIVSSGTNLFEIIPTSDELIVEAEVRPEDIAFVRSGQKARISVTAYDPSVYGFLEGEVQNIAGNTTERPDGSKYFSARIITKSKMFDKKKDQKFEIIPGMEASVELQGDKRSVLEYILTPIQKLQREAFTEK